MLMIKLANKMLLLLLNWLEEPRKEGAKCVVDKRFVPSLK